MNEPMPITPMFSYYSRLQFKGAGKEGNSTYQLRLEEAKRLLRDPATLVAMFEESVAQTEHYFHRHDFSAQDFYPERRKFKKPPGIESTDALGHWLNQGREAPWRVLGDDSLNFYYLDRELVPTRAPGARLSDGRSTSTGPRLDLLLANADAGRPIVGEVKLTSKKGSPDKDSFFALIQALTAAAYLLPSSQQARLRRGAHDPDGRLAANANQLDLYLLTGDAPPHSPGWFELRDCAERLAASLPPGSAVESTRSRAWSSLGSRIDLRRLAFASQSVSVISNKRRTSMINRPSRLALKLIPMAGSSLSLLASALAAPPTLDLTITPTDLYVDDNVRVAFTDTRSLPAGSEINVVLFGTGVCSGSLADKSIETASCRSSLQLEVPTSDQIVCSGVEWCQGKAKIRIAESRNESFVRKIARQTIRFRAKP